MMFHSKIALKQRLLVRKKNFTTDELSFIHQWASCDFIIDYKAEKIPLDINEMDGRYHMQRVLIERGQLKHMILDKLSLPLPRLHMIDSNRERKLAEFLFILLNKSKYLIKGEELKIT